MNKIKIIIIFALLAINCRNSLAGNNHESFDSDLMLENHFEIVRSESSTFGEEWEIRIYFYLVNISDHSISVATEGDIDLELSSDNIMFVIWDLDKIRNKYNSKKRPDKIGQLSLNKEEAYLLKETIFEFTSAQDIKDHPPKSITFNYVVTPEFGKTHGVWSGHLVSHCDFSNLLNQINDL